MSDTPERREVWEDEVLARHRWGQHGDKAVTEHARLKKLWDAIQPVEEDTTKIIDQILALEICNWNLEQSIVALCEAIGNNKPAHTPIGHYASITETRWREVWRYYAVLRNWLSDGRSDGYSALAKFFDPSGEIQKHVFAILGPRDELKELYVERFSLCLERWFRGWLPWDSALLGGHKAAVEAIESEIKKRDPDSAILSAMRMDGDGRLQPCSHKAFRRYEIIISSIGCGEWRGVMPQRGTDGFERADVLVSYLDSIEAWMEKGGNVQVNAPPRSEIGRLLGKPDRTRVFLASLLVSLLRAQELAARKRAEQRSAKPNRGMQPTS